MRERIAAIRPDAYARSRNALDGAVTRLSPYLTHGFTSSRDVLREVMTHHRLDLQHKFVFELGWRAYFEHVWSHLGDGIHRSLHPGMRPEGDYEPVVPDDVRQGRTGIPVIDTAVRALYADGYLHNHARMWLASYLVHLRKIHWHAGAEWLYSHLLDGDLASNHLSWQWVAGTSSSKPYLFNAENVARYAPRDWHSPNTFIDCSYSELERIARSAQSVPAGVSNEGIEEPILVARPAATTAFSAFDPTTCEGRNVWLVHPWALGETPPDPRADTVTVCIAAEQFHDRHSWSSQRWNFVAERMGALAPVRHVFADGDLRNLLRVARSVRTVPNQHIQSWLCLPEGTGIEFVEPSPLFQPVEKLCSSFSQWWRRTVCTP